MIASVAWHMCCEQKYPGKQATVHPDFAQPHMQNGLPGTLQGICPKAALSKYAQKTGICLFCMFH